MFQCLAFFFSGENRYCLVDVHYKVVPSFPYNPPRVAFIRVITVYESHSRPQNLSFLGRLQIKPNGTGDENVRVYDEF